jgi:hypothetical protein
MELQNYLTITTPDAMNAISDQSTPYPLAIGSRHGQYERYSTADFLSAGRGMCGSKPTVSEHCFLFWYSGRGDPDLITADGRQSRSTKIP